MTLDFSTDRWQRVKENNRLWRARKLNRPLVQWTLHGVDPGRPEPATPPINRTAVYNPNISLDQMLDRWDYDLSCQKFLGDAFPNFCVDFGPGVIAEALGARAEPNNDGNVWFYPGAFEGLLPKDMRLEYHESPNFQRLLAICRAATTRFENQVQVTLAGLTGTVDILATLRTTETLLTDLYDYPEEIERLTWELHPLFLRYYNTLLAALSGNPGYSSWAEIFANEPAHILQCDFAYMIGPEMFDRFVLPELRATCKKMPGGAFYHQDGIGQLPHSKSLHSIPELAGIQWQPGDGHPPSAHWYDVQRRIRDDGKLSQTWGGPDTLEALIQNVGDISNIVIIGHGHIKDEARYREVLRKYKIED